MAQVEFRVGVQQLQDGAQQPPRLGRAGELVSQDAHGRFYEAVYRGNVWGGSNPVAGVAPGTALATAGVPLGLYNPPGSGKNLVVLRSSAGYVSGTLGAGSIVYGAAAQSVNPTGGAQVTPKSNLLGNAATGAGILWSGGTWTNAPAILRPAYTLGAFLATTASFNPPLIDEVAGEYIVTPGNYFALMGIAAAGTTPLMLFGLTWEEVPQ